MFHHECETYTCHVCMKACFCFVHENKNCIIPLITTVVYIAQVINGQAEPDRRWSATDGRFIETGVSDNYEHFVISAGENPSESTVVKAYTHRQFTREVIRTGEQAARVDEHLRKNTSQQNSTTDPMDRSHYRENEVYINLKKFNNMSHPHKWAVNGFHKNHKDIKIKNSNNEPFPQEKAMK